MVMLVPKLHPSEKSTSMDYCSYYGFRRLSIFYKKLTFFPFQTFSCLLVKPKGTISLLCSCRILLRIHSYNYYGNLAESGALKLMEMQDLRRGRCFMISMRKKVKVHGMITSVDLSLISFLL